MGFVTSCTPKSGKNSFKNKISRMRQKTKWVSIKKKSAEESKAPGRRETVELSSPGEERRLWRSTQTGFFHYPTAGSGKIGHLAANCPDKIRRVSLTTASNSNPSMNLSRP